VGSVGVKCGQRFVISPELREVIYDPVITVSVIAFDLGHGWLK